MQAKLDRFNAMARHGASVIVRQFMLALLGIRRFELSHWQLSVAAVIFILIFDNNRFFQKLLEIYPLQVENIRALVSISLLCFSLILLLVSLMSFGRKIKFTVSMFLVVSSVLSCFQDEMGIIFDKEVIESIIGTDSREVVDMINIPMAIHIFWTGILPMLFVLKVKLKDKPTKRIWISQLVLISVSFGSLVILFFASGSVYASFFRQHKEVRMYSTPSMFIYSVGRVVGEKLAASQNVTFTRFTATPGVRADDSTLVILVVGETARSQNFSLNGYDRQTNPLLSKRSGIVNFSNVSSCGTATAISVPCMFSLLPRKDFSIAGALNQSNLLDLLNSAGVNVLWRDNNSSSKGVAKRVQYEDYRGDRQNPICDIECRDEGMLLNLQAYIDDAPPGPTLIVLHQMGSHGPAYYKRYPSEYNIFEPSCSNSELSLCSKASIRNAYDNTIVYTDYFLNATISLLEKNTNKKTAMVYIGDHGESLGEYGVFLHGFPYAMAPKQQTQVPMIMWFDDAFDVERRSLQGLVDKPISHDNLTHTMLDLFGVETDMYEPELSLMGRDPKQSQ